jgi:hypothetical protein
MLHTTTGKGVPSISQQIGEIATFLEWVITRHRDAKPENAGLIKDLNVAQRALRFLEKLARNQESLGHPS